MGCGKSKSKNDKNKDQIINKVEDKKVEDNNKPKEPENGINKENCGPTSNKEGFNGEVDDGHDHTIDARKKCQKKGAQF